MIYDFVIPPGQIMQYERTERQRDAFCASLGDPTGFYFPLRKDLTFLQVNRQMRQETLPLYYRKTSFHLMDIDTLIQFLVASGSVGRRNIQSLSFAWDTVADMDWQQEHVLWAGDVALALPLLHASRCVKLLRQCKRLTHLRLLFDSRVLSLATLDMYKSNMGIQELCSLPSIEKVEVCSLDGQPQQNCTLARLLKDAIERPP